MPDLYKQYHIRSYIRNHSLFLDFDLHKNRLKHGRRIKNFLISPLNFTVLLNIPWFVFNVINSNIFHIQYTEYCPKCDWKFIKVHHDIKECDYTIENFSVLEAILNGEMSSTGKVYEQYATGKKAKA